MDVIPFLATAFQIIVLLFSIVIHEVAHGFAARSLGDNTAEAMGRLTLNPLKHLDAFGSVILPTLLILTRAPLVIGWAKPVPYNPAKLWKDMKYGPLKVALAGPAVNCAIALVFGLILRFTLPYLSLLPATLLGSIVFLNLLLMGVKLIPIPPLDGSKLLSAILPRRAALAVESMGFAGILFVFALLYFFGDELFQGISALFRLIAGPEAWQAFSGLT